MKTILKLMCIAVLLSIPVAVIAADRDDYRSGDYYYSRPSDRGDVRLSGTVKITDKKGHKMQITIGGRTEKLRLADDVRVYSGSRRIDIDDLRKGESIRVEGYRSRGSEIIVLAVYLGSSGYDGRDYGRRYGGDSIHGRVVRNTTVFSRTLRVADLEWNGPTRILEIDVRKEAQVIRQGRSISVHEIRTGDVISAEGDWTGSKFIATVVRVNHDRFGRDYNDNGYDRTFRGIVQEVDYRQMRLKIDTGPSKYEIFADGARVYLGGDSADFRDIRKGDEVVVRGRPDRESINADRIEITRNSGRRDWYY